MTVTQDGICIVVEHQDIIRRYSNFTRSEAISDFKTFMSLRGVHNIKLTNIQGV